MVSDSGPVPRLQPRRSLQYELGFFALLVLLFNLPLFTGGMAARFVYDANAVGAGEWWRLFTHPFVHLSWYHLFFDGSAFFILYSSLAEKVRVKRLLYVVASAAGSLLAAIYGAPIIRNVGLCGLSGIAHGLLTISALEMLQSNDRMIFRIGWISFAVIIGKSALEAATGQLAFDFIHIGNLGTPVAICHTGGTLGALICWAATQVLERKTFANRFIGSGKSHR